MVEKTFLRSCLLSKKINSCKLSLYHTFNNIGMSAKIMEHTAAKMTWILYMQDTRQKPPLNFDCLQIGFE